MNSKLNYLFDRTFDPRSAVSYIHYGGKNMINNMQTQGTGQA